MMRRAKWWLASKVRRVAGVVDAMARLTDLETRLAAAEARLAGVVDAAESRLSRRFVAADGGMETRLSAVEARLAERFDIAEALSNARMESLSRGASAPSPDARLERLALIDNAVLGLQRSRIREAHGALEIETGHPVAALSPDHLVPWGTKQDNSREQRFNARLISLVPGGRLSLLDLGCSGGGLVRSMIEQGYLAAGVEGSDYSQIRLRAEWPSIPDFLFTADITRPFRLVSDHAAGGVRFGIVTMWEVIEHIAEPDLLSLFSNIDNHLLPGGLVILSVSPNSDVIEGTELHQTIQQRPWWRAFFSAAGWTDNPAIVAWLGNDLVRWEANAPNSFHFALSRAGEVPVLTKRTLHLAAAPE